MVDTCVAADKSLLDNCAVVVWALCKCCRIQSLECHCQSHGSDAMHGHGFLLARECPLVSGFSLL